MNAKDKITILFLAIIIGGCVSNNAVNKWYKVQLKEIQLEKSKLVQTNCPVVKLAE